MIIAKNIFVYKHYGSGSRRDCIRIQFDSMSFPSTENKELETQLKELNSVAGNFDFLCLNENELMEYTNDGLFLCVDGEISVNEGNDSGFAYCRFLLDEQNWIALRNDVMTNSARNMLIYFSHCYGKIECDEFGSINLKLKFGFEKISWSFCT